MRRLRSRAAAAARAEEGFTLVELLVASAMGIVVLGAIGTMVIGAMRSQPEVSKRAQNVSTARWILERMTREIRSGVAIDQATPTSVSFRTYLRRTTCGGAGSPAAATPAIECQVTYTCTTTSCKRKETAPGVFTGGSETTIFSGIDDSSIFTYSPASEPTFIGIALHFPNPSGPADLTISDGASLRNSILES